MVGVFTQLRTDYTVFRLMHIIHTHKGKFLLATCAAYILPDQYYAWV